MSHWKACVGKKGLAGFSICDGGEDVRRLGFKTWWGWWREREKSEVKPQ